MTEAKFRRLTSSLGYLISDSELWRDWEKAKLIVLDDLGTREKPTDHQYEVLLRSIDLRENKPTVFISNLSIAGLDECYDDRISSRLRGGTVVTVTGDQRKRKGRRMKAVT
jgi:DNA replication protein DnaC